MRRASDNTTYPFADRSLPASAIQIAIKKGYKVIAVDRCVLHELEPRSCFSMLMFSVQQWCRKKEALYFARGHRVPRFQDRRCTLDLILSFTTRNAEPVLTSVHDNRLKQR